MARRQTDDEALIDGLLVASRALVGAAARSIADVDEVTLPQYRALVLLAGQGPIMVSDLADVLGIHTTSATRLCDRLAAKDLIERSSGEDDRRRVVVSLTPAGEALVDRVMARRRKAIATIVAKMEPRDAKQLVSALASFTRASGEQPLSSETLGWNLTPDDR